MDIYYVYAYINSKTGQPYYIGKGKGDRAFQSHGFINIPPNKSNIIFMETNLTEIGAFALERRYINWYGRKIDKSGILLNILEGGNGASLCGELNGMYGRNHNENTRKKMSNNHWTKRKPYSQDHKDKISKSVRGENHPLYGKSHSEETKNKIRNAKLGNKLSEEHKKKLSETRKGFKHSQETREKMRQTKLRLDAEKRLKLTENKT